MHADVALQGAGALEEDRLGAVQFACRYGTPEIARHLLETHRLGLIPMALRLVPSRRLLLFGRTLVLEDHGNVGVAGDLSDGTLRFLRALGADGSHGKADLLLEVWGIGTYRPDAHDPVVHTAVSRARALLGVRGHWIEACDGGYRLATGITLLEVARERLPAAAFETGPEPHTARAIAARATLLPPAASPEPAVADPVIELLERAGALSSSEVARQLGVSEMTALRRLRALCERRLTRREGQGKNTRYHLEPRI